MRSPIVKLLAVVLPRPVIVSRVSDSAVRYAGVKFSHCDVDALYLIRSPVTRLAIVTSVRSGNATEVKYPAAP